MVKNILRGGHLERIDRLEIDFKLNERYFYFDLAAAWIRSSDEPAT
jgi:hypothetical protein